MTRAIEQAMEQRIKAEAHRAASRLRACVTDKLDASEREVIHMGLSQGWLATGPERFGRSLAHGAAAAGEAELLARLVELGESPSARDEEGATPLMMAAATGRLGAIRALVGMGAQVSERDSQGANALFYALNWSARESDKEAEEGFCELLRLGADWRAKNDAGVSVLEAACGPGATSAPMLAALLREGADVFEPFSCGLSLARVSMEEQQEGEGDPWRPWAREMGRAKAQAAEMERTTRPALAGPGRGRL